MKADKAPSVNSLYLENIGSIDVVVLRCQVDAIPKPLRQHKAVTLPRIPSPVASTASAKSADVSEGMGGFMGIFDGAADEADNIEARYGMILDGVGDQRPYEQEMEKDYERRLVAMHNGQTVYSNDLVGQQLWDNDMDHLRDDLEKNAQHPYQTIQLRRYNTRSRRMLEALQKTWEQRQGQLITARLAAYGAHGLSDWQKDILDDVTALNQCLHELLKLNPSFDMTPPANSLQLVELETIESEALQKPFFASSLEDQQRLLEYVNTRAGRIIKFYNNARAEVRALSKVYTCQALEQRLEKISELEKAIRDSIDRLQRRGQPFNQPVPQAHVKYNNLHGAQPGQKHPASYVWDTVMGDSGNPSAAQSAQTHQRPYAANVVPSNANAAEVAQHNQAGYFGNVNVAQPDQMNRAGYAQDAEMGAFKNVNAQPGTVNQASYAGRAGMGNFRNPNTAQPGHMNQAGYAQNVGMGNFAYVNAGTQAQGNLMYTNKPRGKKVGWEEIGQGVWQQDQQVPQYGLQQYGHGRKPSFDRNWKFPLKQKPVGLDDAVQGKTNDWNTDGANNQGGWDNKPVDNDKNARWSHSRSRNRNTVQKTNDWEWVGDKNFQAGEWGNNDGNQAGRWANDDKKNAGRWSNDGDNKGTKDRGWDAGSHKSSSRRTVRFADEEQDANLEPNVKPHWKDWKMPFNKKGFPETKDEKKRHQPRQPYVYPASSLPPLPSEEAKSVKHGVKASAGAHYSHPSRTPAYIDSMEKPYAVFSFKYRTPERLEEILRRKIDRDDLQKVVEQVEKDKLKIMPKEKLIEELMERKRKEMTRSKNSGASSAKSALGWDAGGIGDGNNEWGSNKGGGDWAPDAGGDWGGDAGGDRGGADPWDDQKDGGGKKGGWDEGSKNCVGTWAKDASEKTHEHFGSSEKGFFDVSDYYKKGGPGYKGSDGGDGGGKGNENVFW